jgi:hypothetical protein
MLWGGLCNMAIISQPLVIGTLKHAHDSELLVTWTLKHGHNFKTPWYRDFETCPSFQNSMYMLQVIFIMFSFYLIMIYIEHVPYDCEQFTNQCKVYCLVLGQFIKSPKERNPNYCWPCNELWNCGWWVLLTCWVHQIQVTWMWQLEAWSTMGKGTCREDGGLRW